jgi:hypothetical protein
VQQDVEGIGTERGADGEAQGRQPGEHHRCGPGARQLGTQVGPLITFGAQGGGEPVESGRQSRALVHGDPPARRQAEQSLGTRLPCRRRERVRHITAEPRRRQHRHLGVRESAAVPRGPQQRLARLASGPYLPGERPAQRDHRVPTALAGEVRAGRQPGEALLPAARDSGGFGDAQAAVLAAARFGGDVPNALAAAARQPGAEGLRGLAACWRVAVDQGAGLAAGLDRLEAALRAERDQRADLRAQLAGARATAVMLAGLPAVGLGLGAALGADPLHILLHTSSGLGCLAVGGVLEGLGLWWALRIVRGAEEVAG